MWKQIAERFKDYSDYLIFESMNEVGFDSLSKPDAYALINKINQDFVDIIFSGQAAATMKNVIFLSPATGPT